MRYIIILLLIVQFNVALSQDNILFKVVTYSDGVTINKEPAFVGMYVNNNPDYQIEIPANGYLGIIDRKGNVIKITKSGKVAEFNLGHEDDAPLVLCTLGITFYRLPDTNQAPIMGDSIFLNWRSEKPLVDSNALLQITDISNNVLAEQRTLTKSHTIAEVKNLWNDEPSLLLEVKGRVGNSEYLRTGAIMLQRPTIRQLNRLKFDLARLEGTTDQLLMQSAVFYLHGFIFDSNWVLYKFKSKHQSTTDPILSAYYRAIVKNNPID